MELLTSSIEFQMSLLLFVSLSGYIIASRIHQSAVIGEILVGLLIGPSLLGLITYTDFVAGVAKLGAVILLFVVGMEFKLKEIFNLRYGLIAVAGVVIPWIGGYFTAGLFGYDFVSSVFIGTALTATSIAITANVLKEMGKLQTEAAKAIIGAAVIDDVLGLVALSISVQVAEGAISMMAVSLVLLKAAAFLAAGSLIGQTLLRRLIEYVDCNAFGRKYTEFVFILAMAVAFLYALIAEMIGLSAIVGSFIAGVALGGASIKYGKDHKKGSEYLHIIFASIFFVSLGILADFHAITYGVLLFLIALTIVAVITKVFGCFIPAKIFGMSNKDAAVVGFGMSPRGEVAMIVALLGLNAGVIGQDIYVAIVLMSLFTTIITPLVLRNWFFKETSAKRYDFRKTGSWHGFRG